MNWSTTMSGDVSSLEAAVRDYAPSEGVLGADTDAVLGGWLGLSADEVARLRADRVV